MSHNRNRQYNPGCTSCHKENDCGCNSSNSSSTCGCKTTVTTNCVRHTGANLDCLGVTQGDSLETILSKLNDKYCNPEDIDMDDITYCGADITCDGEAVITSGMTLKEILIELNTRICNIPAGADGLSAYEIWINEGNTGTEQDFLDSLVGADGADGECVCVQNFENVLYRLSSDVSYTVSDSLDESIVFDPSNILFYASTEAALYQVSFEFRVDATISDTFQLVPTVGTGNQQYPNVGSPLSYLSSTTYTVLGVNYFVYHFNVFLNAGESIAIVAGSAAETPNIFIKDNLFVVNKILI